MNRGLTKDNTKQLFKWEGWKKELMWIIIFIIFFIMVWAYYTETKSCKDMIQTECFKTCSFENAVEKVRKANPTATFLCNYETLSCEMSGVAGDLLNVGGLNLTINDV